MSTVSLDKQMHQQLLDMLGAKDQEDAARIIAGFHGAHLSAQAKVRVTDEDVDRAFNASVSVANIATDKRAIRAALESFAARMSQGAQGESTVSETEWVQKLEERVEFLESLLSQGAQGEAAPIPMLLFCPKCGEQHIDAPDDTSENEPYRHPGMWDNPPHRSHLCRACSCIWRPADVATTGVKAISTKGKADNFDPAERAAVPEGWQSIDTAPTDGTPHVRGLRVFSSQDGAFLYWDAYVGRIDTEDGNFVDLGGDQIGWEAMDFTHWHPLSAAPTLAGKEG